MIFFQITQRNKYESLYLIQIPMGYKLILTLLLCAVVSSITPSFEIPLPKKNNFSQSRLPVAAETTLPYIITTPQNIKQPAQIKITKGEDCRVTQVDLNISQGLYIDIPTNYTQIVSSNWQIQIMSFAFSPAQNSIYILLDNGTLITSLFNTYSSMPPKQLTEYKLYSKDAVGAADTWLQLEHTLIVFQKHLFVLTQEKLYKVTINQLGYWTKDANPIHSKVVKAEVVKNKLYLLTSTSLLEFNNSNNQVKTIKSGQKFIDFLFLDETLYLLVKDEGIVQTTAEQGKKAKNRTIWEIEQPQNAIKMRGINKTIFIIYEIKHKNYIAQYFVQEDKLLLNKYYHNYYSVKDIHLLGNYAIIDGYSSYTILHHSINRNSFSNFATVETIYKFSATKVTGITLLDYDFQLTYLLGSKTKISQYTAFTNSADSTGSINKEQLNNMFVQCFSNQSKTIDFSAVYKGLCNSKLSDKEYYCETTINLPITFEYNHIREAQKMLTRKILVWVGLLVLAVGWLVGCLLCRRKLSKDHKEIQQKLEKQINKKQQHSVNMEKTFNQEIKK